MNWKPRNGDVVISKGIKRRVIGELYERPIIDEPGNLIESDRKDAVRYLRDSIPSLKTYPIKVWHEWTYDLYESVKRRLERKKNGIEEENTLDYRIRWYGRF